MKKFQIPSVVKGLIGLMLILAVVIGGGLFLTKHETEARLRDNEKSAAPTAAPIENQCYTMTKPLPFSSGNPLKDAILAKVIKDNAGTPELAKFLDDYKRTSVLDENSAMWKSAKEAFGDKTELRHYLKMTISGEIITDDSGKPENFLEARFPYPDNLEPDLIYVKAALVDSETGKPTEEYREYIATISSNDPRHVLVFPVEKSENDKREGITITQMLPVC